jgi:hypothetical protein
MEKDASRHVQRQANMPRVTDWQYRCDQQLQAGGDPRYYKKWYRPDLQE